MEEDKKKPKTAANPYRLRSLQAVKVDQTMSFAITSILPLLRL